jgi:hypothetical protein
MENENDKKRSLARGFIDYVIKSNEESLGHGPYGSESDSHVDAKPYVEHWQNGLFEGYDGSIWKYYKFPSDVQTEWLKNPENIIYNQKFFTQAITEFGRFLDSQLEKVRNDIRRPFHIQITQSESTGIRVLNEDDDREGKITQKTRDYLKRMTDGYSRPIWHQYMGVRLIPGTLFGDAFGVTEKIRRYIEIMTNPGEVDLASMSRDLHDVDNIMFGAGFTELDFIEHPEDFEQLTAWYGVSDAQYNLSRSLQTTRMKEPLSGMSIITPKYKEIQLFALKPREGVNLKDPLDPDAAWAKPLYRPTSEVVMISIRGQIRAPKIAENLLELKNIKKNEAGRRLGDTSRHEVAGMISDLDAIEQARYVINEYKLPMLDNLEIIMGAKVQGDGKTNQLFNSLKSYDMEANLLVGRQPLGIMASLPTYPRQTLRVPRGNTKRPELSNVMLPGMLAMSGLFRSTKPCANFGILIGLATAGHSYEEIMTEVDGAAKNNRVPGMLVTGRPGAGKTQQLLQMSIQIANMGLPVAFFNPKKEGTLKPTFDHIHGITISMETEYLDKNPGLLDPVFFLRNRKDVADLITDAVLTANRMYEDRGATASQRRTKISSEIYERAMDKRNRTTFEIIFGNTAAGTEEISDAEIRDFIRSKMSISAFWKAFVAPSATSSELQKQITSGRSFLMEWGSSMKLPDSTKTSNDYTDPEIDTVLSINVTFKYAAEVVGGGQGGAIVVDESWVLKQSREAMAILTKGGREWRQANIMLIMGTQRIIDWIDARSEKSSGSGNGASNMSSYFDRYLFMAINEADENELLAYFELTGLPDTEANRRWIIEAGPKRGGAKLPNGYYIDNIYNWAGGLVCGPWPQYELDLGRTDKEGLANKMKTAATQAQQSFAKAAQSGGYGGALLDIMSEDSDLTSEFEEADAN